MLLEIENLEMEMNQSKLLIVDDSTVIQTLSNKIFFGLGIHVVGTKKGGNALDLIEENDISLVILDIILPDMNGMDLARQIRDLPDSTKANLPIIVISGNYDNYSKEDFDRLQIDDYLIKPLDYDNLVQTVKKYLEE